MESNSEAVRRFPAGGQRGVALILVLLAVLVLSTLATSLLFAAGKAEQRLAKCATVLEETLSIPDGIPKELLDKSECVVVFPSVKKFAIGIGGSYGRGAMVCRGGKNFTGPWGPPAMYRLEGANIGFQLGGQATDFILLVLNPKGANSLFRSKVKLGADASVAAGPKGRTATAATDAYIRAEILSYSRSRGLFAGVSLEGSTLRQDKNANKRVYGRQIEARQIALGGGVPIPASGRHLINLLQKASPRNQSEQVASHRSRSQQVGSPEPAEYRSSETQERVAVGTVVLLRPGVPALNVRTLPSVEGTIIGQITPSQEFTVLERQNRWCRIQFTPETQGWASGRYLQPQ